ncbi:hypothetical protein GF354_05775 [Candidatus Peregrinibacteria bacterium]|nr:hypothetical protein [Candidatus Peregrinibacteria bacterium]
MSCTHYAFSDDSAHVDGRYNSLALVSIETTNYSEIIDLLTNLYSNSGITIEFKWQKLRDAKHRFAAEKLVDFVFQNSDKIRIDIITWDLEDSRHNGLQGRDDSENLVRMYYHLASSTLSKRWPISGVCWKWYPDNQSSVCWTTLSDCLKTKKHNCTADLFDQNPDFERVDLNETVPSESHDFPLIQIADLFAGMGAYSFGHYERYQAWNFQNNAQTSMFEVEEPDFSNSEEERFKIITKVNEMAKERRLQMALDSTKGFSSYNPDCFINYWLYVPQHEYDKAPVKNS